VRLNAISTTHTAPAITTHSRGKSTTAIAATVAAFAVWPEGNEP